MFSKDVRKTLKIAWPLLTGIGFIMIGNGLQGTLLSLRAHIEGFPVYATGLIMSAYYLGFLVGCIVVPKLIASVGHIRVFAGFASLASTTILFHGVFVDPWIWGSIRVLSGFSFVGLFVVAESWLNNIAPNKLRARVFSSYMFVVHGGLFLGQFLINLVSVEQIELFILVSVLISLSLIPITLANRPAPGYEEPDHLPFKNLFSFSLLPLAGVFAAGLTGTSILTMGPIYAYKNGFSSANIAFFMGAYILGATILPLFIGSASDRLDRRHVIIGSALAAFLTVTLITGKYINVLLLIFITGGLIASLYSVCIAYMNDRIKSSQITSVSASLILLNGVGCCIGPFLSGVLIDTYGESAMFIMISVVFMITVIIGIYKAFTGRIVDVAKQKNFVFMPTRSSTMVVQINEKD